MGKMVIKAKGTNFDIYQLDFGDESLYCLRDSETEEVLTPMFSLIEFNEEQKIFYVEDIAYFDDESEEIRPDVNIYFNLDEKLNIVGSPYNDYFDEVGGEFNFSKVNGQFENYQNYKRNLIIKIFEDKKERVKRHKENQDKYILRLVEGKSVNED